MVADGARDIGSMFKGFRRDLPQLLIIVASAVWLITLLLPASWLPPTPELDAVRSLAYAVVAGGFFGWLTKSIAFRKVLQEELTDILYSPKHLSEESPRLQYLQNTLVAIGLPEQVAKTAAPIFVERLHSPEHPYYYTEPPRLSWRLFGLSHAAIGTE